MDSHHVLLVSTIPCFIIACVCQNLDQPRGPWTLVFKAVQGKADPRHASTTAFLVSTDTVNEDSLAARTDFTLSSEMYKSSLAHDWSKTSVQAVKLSFFKNNTERAYAVFDARGKTPANWFDCSSLIDVPYTDFPSAQRDCIFDTNKNRKFFLGGDSFCNVGYTILKDTDATAPLCAFFDSLTLHSRPYFLFATNNSDWDTNNDVIPDTYDSADSMAIFLQVWITAMKGGMGSMYDLWTGSTILNTDSSLTTTTNYKAELVESWSTRFVDQAMFSIYETGVQKAFVVFSVDGGNKNSWFGGSNVLYSSYSDLNSSSISLCSITGDGSRHFLVMKDVGTCAQEEAWMAVLDDELNVTVSCQWENVTRPQYFYSGSATAVPTTTGGAPNPQFMQGDVMGVFIRDWHLVMKVATDGSLGGFASVYDLWTTTGSLNEKDATANTLTAGTATFKSFLVDEWDTRYVKAVKVSFYKNGQEVAFTMFDPHGATSTSWLACDRIVDTSYSAVSSTICNMEGAVSEKRRFLIASTTSDCSTYAGWQIIVDKDSPASCTWEQSGTKPLFLYSSGSDSLASGMEQADVMAIFIDTDECNPNPCKNGGSCEDIVADFNCTCVNNYYGKTCSDLDGGFDTWTQWTTCTASCTPGGTQSRSRTCTNPSPQFDGLNCTGAYTESMSCNNVSCPVHGNWTDYTWQPCTITCGTGVGTATRTCSNPSPAFGGDDCVGDATFQKQCHLKPCECSKEDKHSCFWDKLSLNMATSTVQGLHRLELTLLWTSVAYTLSR